MRDSSSIADTCQCYGTRNIKNITQKSLEGVEKAERLNKMEKLKLKPPSTEIKGRKAKRIPE